MERLDQVVWDEELGKYVCQLDTYTIYKKTPGIFWEESLGHQEHRGLITTHMYASGQYEVRAKVPKTGIGVGHLDFLGE